MNTKHSYARLDCEYHPTIIENRLLIERLAIQVIFLNHELKRSWIDFRNDPVAFGKRSSHHFSVLLKKFLSNPNALPACVTAVAVVACIVMLTVLFDRMARFRENSPSKIESPVELVMIDLSKTPVSEAELKIGKDGPGRVGFQNTKGEGSGESPKRSQGGGGGGDRNPLPSQVGELPPRSEIPAAVPITPPVTPPALPVAGIDIDPALWKDLKAPVYGDPRSTSEIPSKGPGEGDGIGTGKGTGIGEGTGRGVFQGHDGNIGGGSRQIGCCDTGGGSDQSGRTFSGGEVQQRARLLHKPEPYYTEEARRNQITGTVKLRVVFSSEGEVVQIRAVHTLPFGLTERAIAAARQIRFVPAMKDGRPVSVFMQLEYNFNLY